MKILERPLFYVDQLEKSTLSEWMKSHAGHRAWQWKVGPLFWVFLCFVKSTSVSSGVTGPHTPNASLPLQKPLTSFKGSLKSP